MNEGEVLITKIRVISKINQEIIDRIQAQNTKEPVSMVWYNFTPNKNTSDVPEYKVEEIKEECLGIDVLLAWRKTIKLKKPIDLFNDKLDFNCEKFQDVVRLNESMSIAIEKYSFLDPKRAASELEKFKDNFEILQTCLGEIDQIFRNSYLQESKLDQYSTEIDEINHRFRLLYNNTDIYNNRVDLIDDWMTPCSSHTINGRTATLIQSQYGCLLSKKGYNTGVRKWHLRIISRTSTCMVGVAPDTVSKTGAVNNYNSKGFFMNLADGSLYSGPPMSKSNSALLNKAVSSGILTLTLNCTNRTLTYTYEGKDHVGYTDLPMDRKLYLAWDNDTTAGSVIEIISSPIQ
jgi:hypothetical protein